MHLSRRLLMMFPAAERRATEDSPKDRPCSLLLAATIASSKEHSTSKR